jgi:L-2-hydroxyglutarate oxidase LhgO
MVYSVPIKGHPFGGSHSCVTIDGKIKLGPAMIPCLNYEEYEKPP